MQEHSDRFLELINALEEIADAGTPDEAASGFDAPTLQAFWRAWPHVSSWAGGLWRTLNDELAEPSRPVTDPDLDEVGGPG